MGTLSDIGEDIGEGIDALTGQTAADAATEAARIQQEAVQQGIGEIRGAEERGLGFLDPFSQIGQQGLSQAGFLTDPQAQFDFLQNNPLFKSALEQAGTETKGLAAARGRLSAGDTLQDLSKNVLLAASPLIQQQKQSIGGLLGLGAGIAGQQAGITTGTGANIADLIGSGGAAGAAGVVGAANAQSQALQNLLLAGGIAFSDRRLKLNISKIGQINRHNIYSWTWNKIAKDLFGLSGSSMGVVAQEIPQEFVLEDRGYLKVNYSGLFSGN